MLPSGRWFCANDGSGEAGTGSGVIFDSGAAPEYEECVLKLKFMTEDTPEFDLIETMAFDPAEGYLLFERHLQRLQKSAAYFGFRFSEDHVAFLRCWKRPLTLPGRSGCACF